jgi:endonuclease YncB( thermonuclease family)
MRRRADSRWGSRAKQFADDLAFDKNVTVRARDIDRYKRTVAEIILPDGRNLNHELVSAGMAWWYRQFANAVLRALEQEARAAKRGLWVDPSPVPPWEWGKRRGCSNRGPRYARLVPNSGGQVAQDT